MSLYNRKYVYFEWDRNLIGKKGFVADSIAALKNLIYDKGVIALVEVKRSNSANFHFTYNHSGQVYQFCYYDPNYKCKVAYAEKKPIQYWDHLTRRWVDYTDKSEPDWDNGAQWQVKPADEHWYVSYNTHGYIRSNRRDTFVHEILYAGTSDECYEYTKAHSDLEPILKDYAKGKPIQYFLDGRWNDLTGPVLAHIIGIALFRPKPKDTESEEKKPKWITWKAGDVICHNRTYCVITCMSYGDDTNYHVHFNGDWHNDTELKDWEKVK